MTRTLQIPIVNKNKIELPINYLVIEKILLSNCAENKFLVVHVTFILNLVMPTLRIFF